MPENMAGAIEEISTLAEKFVIYFKPWVRLSSH